MQPLARLELVTRAGEDRELRLVSGREPALGQQARVREQRVEGADREEGRRERVQVGVERREVGIGAIAVARVLRDERLRGQRAVRAGSAPSTTRDSVRS